MGLDDLILLLGLILANGVFSMAEIAIVSARRSKLETLAKKGDKRAKAALALGADQSRFLSTVQVGITLIGILTGAVGGGELTNILKDYLLSAGIENEAVARPLALGIVVLIITYLSIVLGELVPKKLGLHNPEAVSRAMAPTMRLLSQVTAPLVWILSSSTNGLVKLLRLKESEEPSVTEEEIKELINQGTNLGEFEEVEQDVIERVFQLTDRRVASMMSPKMDVEWLDINDSFSHNRNIVLNGGFSQFPICDGDIDEVIGILNTKKFLVALSQSQGKPLDLRSLMDTPLFVPENMTGFKVLETFKTQKRKLAMVVDEYGAVQGMITMHDLIEALVGDLEEAATPEDEQIIAREDGTFLIDALLPFEEFLSHFEVEDVDAEDRTGFHTLGGFLLHLGEQIPRTGEIFVWRNFSFEVVDMDGNRIDKILVKLQAVVDEGEE